jgi:hypothetical protein
MNHRRRLDRASQLLSKEMFRRHQHKRHGHLPTRTSSNTENQQRLLSNARSLPSLHGN